MNNEKIIKDAAALRKKHHAGNGKIALLHGDIREEINLRLYNAERGPIILAWLNALPTVKKILAAQFAGVPINLRNLSNWRKMGYWRWLAERQNVGSMENLGKYAAGLAKAAGGNVSRGVAAAASGKLLEFLDKQSDKDPTAADVAKCADAAAKLLKSEQNNERLEIARERLRQHETSLRLKRDKQQRDGVAIGLRIFEDAYARQIAAAPLSNAEKIEAIGFHMFGKFWDPRPIPAPPIQVKGN
jgi:hypothetical protein